MALVVGSFISFTVSGSLTILLLFDGMLFWDFVPVLQALLVDVYVQNSAKFSG